MKLKDGLFYLVVYGPGYGESIVLRDPGGAWVIVDGCLTNGKSPAADILREHDASWSSVVITHPHLDHALGLDMVLGRPGDGLIGCVGPSVAEPMAWSQTADGERHVREGTVEHVLAAIHDRWTNTPECKWEMRRGESKNVGDLTLTVLHPDDETVAARPMDANRLSSVLLVTWRNVHLLLGGDVLAADWTQVGSTFREMGVHQGMKLPHHGSCGAVHECWGEGVAQRTWIATPYNRGHKLPRFDDGQGISWLLGRVDEVHLTGLPVRHDLQGKVPHATTRQALRDGNDPPPEFRALSAALTFHLHPQVIDEACFVAAGFDEEGALQDIQHGPGAIVVREAEGAA